MSKELLNVFMLVALAAAANAQPNVTVIGGGYHPVPDGTAAAAAYFPSISGLTFDPAGNLVVSDRATLSIHRLDGTGVFKRIPATSDFASGRIRYDSAGNLYSLTVARLYRMAADGTLTTVAGTGVTGDAGDGAAATKATVSGGYLAFDSKGSIYISGGQRIRRIRPDGVIEAFAGVNHDQNCSTTICTSPATEPALTARLFSPGAITVDPQDNVYFAETRDGGKYTIRRITQAGSVSQYAGFGSTPTTTAGPAISARIFSGYALDTDAAGNLFLSDGIGIVQITPTGNLSRTALPSMVEKTPLGDQILVALGGAVRRTDGSVYFYSFASINRLTAQKTFQSVASNAPAPAPDGTPAKDAWLMAPSNLMVSPQGEPHFLELCSIRKMDAAGLLRTVAVIGSCGVRPGGAPNPVADIRVNAMTMDQTGRIIVAGLNTSTTSTAAGGLFTVLPNGTFSALAGTSDFTGDQLLAVDSAGRIYGVSWQGTGQSQRVNRRLPDGTVTALTSPRVDASLQGPLVADPNDRILMYGDYATPVIFDAPSPSAKALPVTMPFTASSGRSIAFHPTTGEGWRSGFLSRGAGGQIAWFPTVPSPLEGPLAEAAGSSKEIAFSPAGDLYLLDSVLLRKVPAWIDPPPPVISDAGIVNAASLEGGAIAPGELISIFGKNFAQSPLDIAAPINGYDGTPYLPTALRYLQAKFNGRAGAITAASPTQINAFVPQGISLNGPVQVTVEVDGLPSNSVSIPQRAQLFGLSTSNASGEGQGAVLNQDYSVNSAANPAPVGSVVSLFGTGAGAMAPTLLDGAFVVSTPLPQPTAEIQVAISGRPAKVSYAGAAPSLPIGVLQLNVQIPDGVPAGPALVVVRMGDYITTKNVTVAVK